MQIKNNKISKHKKLYIQLKIIFKIVVIFIYFLLYSFNLYLYRNNSFINIDNKINITIYEDNINFSKYSTNIKIIAIYLPNFYFLNYTFFANKDYYFLNFVNNILPRYNDQRKKEENNNYLNNYNLTYAEVIKKQIELAKSHGIFGFAIYYYWFCGKKLFDTSLNIIYENKLEFNYMLIWKNEKIINEKNEIILEEKYEEIYEGQFIEDIKKYLIDNRYIRLDGKPVIGIYEPKKIPHLKSHLLIWRRKAKEIKIGELLIISNLNSINFKELNETKIFDAAFDLPPKDLLMNKIIKNTRENYYYYYGLFYSNIISEKKEGNITIYRGSMLEYDNSAINKVGKIFGDYSPKLFYLLNKQLIKWTKDNYNESNRVIFINAWNNYFEGIYLEPDSRYGFASINALSKALFNLPYKHSYYNLQNLKIFCLVAIQAHIFYEDLINEIINKTNNIPVKYDLYITTDNYKKMIYIKDYTDKYSKSKNVFIKIVENKGRDILPFLIQFRDVLDKYKYFCHIHSKKTINQIDIGRKWRTYLYENLLGDSELISEILSDFENNDKLGFIYPENYYDIVRYTMNTEKLIKESMNYLLNKLFPGYIIGDNYFDFPAGDMFWGRSVAVKQIFRIDLKNDIPNESNSNLLWAIERIWLFIVKINGFFYKKYFKYKAVD